MRINKSLKKIFFTLLFFGISSFLFHFDVSATTTRPYYGWTRITGGIGNDVGQFVITDTYGNIYIGGNFGSSNLDFNTTGSGSSDIKSTAGSDDVYITKYNPDGSYGWTRTIGGTGSDQLFSITFDDNSNLYITGQFASTNVDFNTTGSGSSDIKSTNGGIDAFITKYNSNGSYAWTRIIGGSSSDFGRSVTSDNEGNVYFTGAFASANVEFNTTGTGSSDIKSTAGNNDIFTTKYNSDGSYGWTRTIGGTGGDIANSITNDNNGNIYLTGPLGSTNTEFNTTGSGTTDIHSSAGVADIFILKYNYDGSYGWTNTIGGTLADTPNSVVTDTNGNVYFSGAFQSANVQFNTTGSGNSDIRSSAGSTDIFITKYNSDGTYGRTYTVGGTGGEFGLSLAIDNSNNLYVTGNYNSNNINFNTTGSGTSDVRSTNGANDQYLIKYYSDGSYAWTNTFGGTLTDFGRSVAIFEGKIYITGQVSSANVEYNTTGFGNSDIKSVVGSNDIFITKLIDTEIGIRLLESGVASDTVITINENGSVNYEIALSAEPSDDVTISLSYGNGITISSSTLTFTPSNWNIPQTITISAVNDSIVSGNRSVTISHTVTSDDSLYNGILVPDMTISITEDDVAPTTTPEETPSAGVSIGKKSISISTDENEEEAEEEITITPSPSRTTTPSPSELPETVKNGEVKGEGIKFATVALCSFPLVIVVIIMILAARKKKRKQNES